MTKLQLKEPYAMNSDIQSLESSQQIGIGSYEQWLKYQNEALQR